MNVKLLKNPLSYKQFCTFTEKIYSSVDANIDHPAWGEINKGIENRVMRQIQHNTISIEIKKSA